jgi:predicted ATPase/class 3 adenylate cyclase
MLPTGTVTFLLTDIEGSTPLWEKQPEAMKAALARHDAILRKAIESSHGQVVKSTGDGVLAVFQTALEAVWATIEAQQAFQAPLAELRIAVRMGVHTGEAELREGDYHGQSLNRTARIMAVGYGGQILLSGVTAELVREQLPANTTIKDLGEHRLKGLTNAEHLCQLVAPGLPVVFPALQSLTTLPNNLPLQLTSFIGRGKEIPEIRALLNSARLVTLTGSGGTGKTRLSLEVGSELLMDFPNGVWLIELAPLVDPEQIVPALAQAFGLQEMPFAALESLVVDYLRDKKLLLVLDNCEHLIAACARMAEELLRQCAGLKVLASSRESLGIAGEVAYRIPSLADSESTCLFEERARAANSTFAVTDANAASIAQICARLDGIPLAIELAAARTRLLSAEQIASRLDDRFRLLVGGSRTALPRQQTLRALIDWSYDLLSEEEQRLLRSAAVFVGGWPLEALEAVSEDPDTIEQLEQLINKSLVISQESGREMRYFMLETIRQYAREKLFDAKEVAARRDRHFTYFLDRSEKMWEAFLSYNFLPMVASANNEADNLRAALQWGLENHTEENVRLAANFCVVSSMLPGAMAEGVTAARNAVERLRSLPAVSGEADLRRQKIVARALFAMGMMGMGMGDNPFSVRALGEAITLSREIGDKQMLGYSLEMYYNATGFLYMPGRDAAAREGFAIFSQEINDNYGLNLAYMNMARIAAENGNESEKQMYMEKLKKEMRAAPASFQMGIFLLFMGKDESSHGNFMEAKRNFMEAEELYQALGSVNFANAMRSEIGHVERVSGNLQAARAIYQETIKRWQELGNRSAVAHQLECFGLLAIPVGQHEQAAKLFAAAEALRERCQSPMTDEERVEYDRAVGELRGRLAEAEVNAAWAQGRGMTMEGAVRLALGEGKNLSANPS